MRKLITILIAMLPVVASAQKDLFMNEFNEVNNWFFIQQEVTLVQKYIYYDDASMIHPIDSSICRISKKNTAIHYMVSGLESFSDSGYMVKISHTGKYIVVSKTVNTDTAQLRGIFNEAFSGFKVFTKKISGKNSSSWELSGGTAGVNSAKIIMDLENHKIRSLEIFMAGDHPLVSPFRKPGQEAGPTVIIKVDYEYLARVKKEDAETLSDIISIAENSISPAGKYKEYAIKSLIEKQ